MRPISGLLIGLLSVAAGSCDRPRDPVGADRREVAEPHEHEERHDQMPRSVALSAEVVREAGITTVPVSLGKLARTVRLPGEVVADPDRSARVAARMEGIIEAVRVRPGDAVKAGAPLAVVRAPNLQSLRATAAALQAKATSARANAERVAALVEKRMASHQEVVAAKAEADALEAEARAARERLRALGVKRSRGAVSFTVRAPIAGIVVERHVVPGDPVVAETVVASVVATDEVWFLGHVFERDVARVEVGSATNVRLNAYPDRTFSGNVEYVSHQVDPGARTLAARIPLANEGGLLRLGLFGTAHVEVVREESEPTLVVPNSAVTRMLGKTVVFVRQADGDFEVHDIVTGEADGEQTEILHGLKEGESVVDAGAFTIKSALLRGTFGEDGH